MSQPILFFDGYCGLCNWSVDFTLKRDKKRLLRYSPLQGEQIKKMQLPVELESLDTLYVWTGSELLEKSKAWLWVMSYLGGCWFFITFPLRIFPLFILNFFYDLVAQYRYKIFGKRESCRIPSDSEKALFLD